MILRGHPGSSHRCQGGFIGHSKIEAVRGKARKQTQAQWAAAPSFVCKNGWDVRTLAFFLVSFNYLKPIGLHTCKASMYEKNKQQQNQNQKKACRAFNGNFVVNSGDAMTQEGS